MSLLRNRYVNIKRAQDDFALGSITLQRISNYDAYRVRPGQDSPHATFPTLDAAVAWITTNPFLPDLISYGHLAGVYGPRLADWHGCTLIGKVCAHDACLAPRVGTPENFDASPFVLLSPSGQVHGRLLLVNGTWSITVIPLDGGAPIKRQRARLHDALHLLYSLVAQHWAATHHEKMQHLSEIPDVAVRAEAFLVQRPLWQHDLESPPDRPACGFTLDVNCLERATDGFKLGRITKTDAGYEAVHHGFLNGEITVRGATCSNSLDAAVAWVASNPHAPDPRLFPRFGRVYGQVLATLPQATIVGQVGALQVFSHDPSDRFAVFDTHLRMIGTVGSDLVQGTWMGRVMAPARVEIPPDPDMMVVFTALFLHLVHAHPEDLRPQVRADKDRVLDAMRHFAEHHSQIVAEFEHRHSA